MNTNHTICRNCDPPHVDNCKTCFGYGMKRTGVPMDADTANIIRTQYDQDNAIYAKAKIMQQLKCPECGGTIYGIDTGDTKEAE